MWTASAQASEEYFGNLGLTMLSLFMSISGGVSWENVISPLKEVSLVWVVVYLFYISFTYFAVLNVVTAVTWMHDVGVVRLGRGTCQSSLVH